MLLHRKNDNREASWRSVSRYGCVGCSVGGIELDAEQEFRADEQPFDRLPYAEIEPALGAPPFVEAQQRRDIRARHRTPERAASQRGEDPFGAGRVAGVGGLGRHGAAAVRAGRVTDEDAASARRVTRPRDLVRTADGDVRQRRRLCAAAAAIRDDQGLDGCIGPCQEGRPDFVGTRRHRKLYLQPARATASTLPLSRTGRSLLLGKEVHPLSVDGQLELELLGRCTGIVDASPGNLQHEGVETIDRKGAPDENTATRAERQLVEMAVLRKLSRHLIRVNHPRDGRIRDGEAADLAGGAEIALDQSRRHEECVRHVVEALSDVIGGQQQRDVHLFRKVVERQQIADSVLVFGPVEPTHRRRASRVRRHSRCVIERALDRGTNESAVVGSG